MRRNIKNRFIPIISAVLLAAAFTGCTAGQSDISESGTESTEESIISIEQDTEAETKPIIRMEADGDILPILGDVTTAEDNSVLSPVYLSPGDEHRVVKALQQRLMSLGYMDNDETTNYYGNATAEAVRRFQRQQDLTQDGICGPDTWDRIFAADAPYYMVSNGDDGTDILLMQERLYELGYLSVDNVTGHFGDATEAAVRNMQEKNGISVDGTVGRESYNLLYSEDVKANVISRGEQSELVKEYQQILIDLGYLRSEEADGNFGGATERAVREFQSRNDQVVDGYLGPGTVAALTSPDAKPFGLRVGDSSASVTTVQERLVHYGYMPSRLVTGYYGSATEAAVKQFQRYNNLSQDGVVGAQTMAKLESSDAKKKPASAPTVTGSNSSSGSSSSGSSSSGSSSRPSVGSGGATVSGSASNLIGIASSKLGCPYVWGAKGPNSFDCSGFVYWCLNQAGVSQSYLTSSGWRNPGRYQRVSNFDSIQAGDIVVVSGHVGIAAGGGTVIDASSSNGRVVHRSLSSWWRNNFIVAWRIFA